MFAKNEMRAPLYAAFSLIQFVSLTSGLTTLLLNAVMLLITALCYTWPAIQRMPFTPSASLGGDSAAQYLASSYISTV